MLRNERKFIQYEFGADKVKEASEIKWYSINNIIRADHPVTIYQSDINMNDNQFSLGSFMKEQEKGFWTE